MRRRHRRAHLVTWIALAAILPAVLLAALALRPGAAEAPVLLAPPVRATP